MRGPVQSPGKAGLIYPHALEQYIAIAAAAGGGDAPPRGGPRREAPKGQATEGGGHSRSRRGDAAAIGTAASAIPVSAALCAQAIVDILEVVCGDILVARVERQTESTHFRARRCPNSLCNRSKGDCTKTGDGRNEMDRRCLDQLFTGNHPNDARGSDSGVFTDLQEMFWATIR